MGAKVEQYVFQDRELLTTALADQIASLLTAGIIKNGVASLAVSGGSTPVPLFERLSSLPLPWENVQITLVDERWVAPTADDSNERLVRTHLLKNRAAPAVFTGMKNPAATAEAGEEECEQQFTKISRPFDVLILGMGNDGHTASLFPGAKKLSRATDMNSGRICMGIAPLAAPHERMTLTLPAILHSSNIILHITGQDKKDVLNHALAEGPMTEMPIRYILRQQQSPLSIYWAE
ncbi:MAG: 6-phosphogluconolactonase [Desulfocapsa sp.]|nr:6-phosphogluconolactonase [Desulfocapsa sp.]